MSAHTRQGKGASLIQRQDNVRPSPLGASHGTRRRQNKNDDDVALENDIDETNQSQYVEELQEDEEFSEDDRDWGNGEGTDEEENESDSSEENSGLGPADERPAIGSPRSTAHLKAHSVSNRRREAEPREKTLAKKEENRTGRFWATLVVVCIILGVAGIFKTGGGRSCQSGMQKMSYVLRNEVENLSEFAATFDVSEFVSAFQDRLNDKPTVLHLVGTDELALRRLPRWLQDNSPCAGSKIIKGDAGDLVKHLIATAQAYHKADRGDSSSCRVILTVLLENGEIQRNNRDFMESIIDDTSPYVGTHDGRNLPSNDWCVFFLDHWTGERAKLTKEWKDLGPTEINQQIRDITRPLWSDRFYQRIQSIFFVR